MKVDSFVVLFSKSFVNWWQLKKSVDVFFNFVNTIFTDESAFPCSACNTSIFQEPSFKNIFHTDISAGSIL